MAMIRGDHCSDIQSLDAGKVDVGGGIQKVLDITIQIEDVKEAQEFKRYTGAAGDGRNLVIFTNLCVPGLEVFQGRYA